MHAGVLHSVNILAGGMICENSSVHQLDESVILVLS